MSAGPSTLRGILARRALEAPDAVAILDASGRGISYGALDRRVRQLAQQLSDRGASSGARIAVVVPNGPDMALAFLAAACRGTCAPLNPALRAAEFAHELASLGVRLVMVRRGDDSPVRAVAAVAGIGIVEIDPLLEPLPMPATDDDDPDPQPGDVALVLQTSGTTGRPKVVPLTHANLAASASGIAAHLRLGPGDRCLNVMPLFHIHGLVGALLAALASGGSVVCTPGFDAQRFFAWVGVTLPTWYTAVPTIHQGVLAAGARYAQQAPGHRFRFVRSSSAALAPRTLGELEALLDRPVVEAYGMTEAAHQMASNPLPPGRRKPGSVGRSAGAEIAIMDSAGQVLGPGARGEVVVRGPGVIAGYEGDAEANARAFTGTWFRTGDEGVLDDEGYLRITGRLKEIVNRGGEKIAPREIDEALLEHCGVAQAAAFAVPHPSLGEDLAAAVVALPGAALDEATLRQYLFDRLAPHKVPSQIVFVESIPKGATGKVQRSTLHECLAPLLRAPFEVPRDATEQRIAAAFSQALGIEPVGRWDNFFALGGDSLKAAAVAGRLAESTAIAIHAVDLFRHPTVATLATHIDTAQGTEASWRARIASMSDDEVDALLRQLEADEERTALDP